MPDKRDPTPKLKELYGCSFNWAADPLQIEFDMCKRGGRFKFPGHTKFVGISMEFHFKRAMEILWPEIVWHKWAEMQLRLYLNYRIIGQMGPASTGKTFVPSACVLMDYYLFPNTTTCLITSTTRESLEMRVLGEIKKLHRLAKGRYPDLISGNLIEGRQRIVTDDRSIAAEGRDFRNGIVGVACKKGQSFQGIEEFVGIKNKRLRALFDEAQFLPRSFCDSIANLNKNPDFKGVVSGNPKDITDALGVICEPAAHLGGWDSGIDQTEGSKSWETRWPRGVCLQLVGTDSPNLDGKLGIPLITQQQIDEDISFYGQDSLQFSMMDLGRMPRGQAAKRVITRQMCLKFHAVEEPVWKDTQRVKIGFLDAAYRGVGGDRCVFGELQFGYEAVTPTGEQVASAIISQKPVDAGQNQILALIDTVVVPVTMDFKEQPEDQIALFVKDQCERRGISPENFFLDSTGRGSLMSAFGRLWSPHINGVEFGGAAHSDRKVSSSIDVYNKDYYFNMVSALWFNVSYVIQAGQFRGMTEEVMAEGCFREWGHQAKKIQVEPKDRMKLKSGRSPDLFDALCFTLGTEIETVYGHRSIESIRPGDFVVTPLGSSMVATTHCSESSDIWKVETECGTLTGTGGHKVFTWNRGWVRLDSLALTDEIESSNMKPLWDIPNSLFTTDRDIGFKAMVDIIHGGAGRRDFYIESYGVNTMGLFRLGIAYIIKMVIGQTIPLITWSWLRLQNTLSTIWRFVKSSLRGWLGILHPLEESPRGNGMAPRLDWSGTVFTEGNLGKIERHQRCRALIAENSSKHGSPNAQGSVPDLAPRSTVVRSIRIAAGYVMCAAKALLLIAMTGRATARVTVPPSRLPGSRKVYNLTLEHHNAYYANGVLVANCVGVEGAIRRGFRIKMQLSVAHKRVDRSWKKNLQERSEKYWRGAELNYVA